MINLSFLYFVKVFFKNSQVSSVYCPCLLGIYGITPSRTTHFIFFTGENIFENLFIAITTSVDKIELNGKECYLIRDGNTEKFIDVNTGFAIKMIDNQNNRTVDYKYEFGTVKDDDIAKPDTTGYTINQ